MNNSSGMAVVDPIDKLEEEEFDLVSGDGVFMFGHILLHIIVKEIKN